VSHKRPSEGSGFTQNALPGQLGSGLCPNEKNPFLSLRRVQWHSHDRLDDPPALKKRPVISLFMCLSGR
jgi:hypothetical protein